MESSYGGVVVTPQQVVFTKTTDPAIGTNACGSGSSTISGVDLNPGSGTNFTSSFNLGVTSAVMGGLFGDAGAIYFATISGDGGRRPGHRRPDRRDHVGVHLDGLAGGDVMPARRRPRGQRGFTLLELLITLSVTTIGLVGLLSLHLSIARGNDGASRSAEAQQLAVSELESLRAMSIPIMMTDLTTNSNPPLPTAPRVRVVTGRSGMSFTITTTVVALPSLSAGPSLIRIRTVVTWTEEGGVAGGNGGQLDHSLPLEVVRTRQEVL
jgi:prepilin-type N-terminal cleavage/methylation domain-containing protein